MVFAAINACPVRGGKLKSVDESVLSGTPGIVGVVKLENAVAVVATGTFWRAKRALSRLQPEWDVGAAGSVDSGQLSAQFRAALTERMMTARNDGNLDRAMSGALGSTEMLGFIASTAATTATPALLKIRLTRPCSSAA